MSKLAIYKLADLVKAQDGSEVTLNDLQSQVSTLAQSDARFNNKPAGSGDNKYCSIWVSDILTDGSEFKAVISAMDGKYYEVGINVADGKVTSLNTDATEVVRKTMYVSARDKHLFFEGSAVEGDVKAGGPGSGPQGGSGEASNKATHRNLAHDMAMHKSAYEASEKAHNASANAYAKNYDIDSKSLHERAASAHEAAAQDHRDAGNDKMAESHDEHANEHFLQAKAIGKFENKTSAKAAQGEMLVLNCRSQGIPILLAAGKEWKFGQDTSFQWMPGGLNHIVAGTEVNKEERAVDLWLDCNEKTAKTVKASFARAVTLSPRRPPFGCVEHHEQEKAFEPQDFSWNESPEPGVYCTAKPTKLGEANVNGRLHTSFSPSFGSDADYTKAKCHDCDQTIYGADACSCGGAIFFPEGVRGSETNPAEVKAVSNKSVGSLTNWPAFKTILPVTAKEPGGKKKDAKVLTGMDKIRAKADENQKRLDDIRAKFGEPSAPINPGMEKIYAKVGVNG